MTQTRHGEGAPQEPDGVRWLRILGFQDHLGQPIEQRGPGGEQLLAEDFPKICGEHAIPAMHGFERIPETDPRYDFMRTTLRKRVAPYLGIPVEEI